MGRPRKVSDQQLLAACSHAIGLHGPKFTLAQVAHAAGVATATVAERFGSKQALLEVLLTADNAGLEQRMIAAANRGGDPVSALRAAAVVFAEDVDDAATAINHLAQFGADLANEALRVGIADQRDLVRRVLRDLVSRAEADLPGAPEPERSARILAALVNGIQLDWAMRPQTELIDQLHGDLDAVLDAWRVAPDASAQPRRERSR